MTRPAGLLGLAALLATTGAQGPAMVNLKPRGKYADKDKHKERKAKRAARRRNR